MPGLDVHIVRDDEGDGDELPVPALAMIAVASVEVARLGELTPQPPVALQQPDDVHRPAHRVIARERGGAVESVGWLVAGSGHATGPDVALGVRAT